MELYVRQWMRVVMFPEEGTLVTGVEIHVQREIDEARAMPLSSTARLETVRVLAIELHLVL